MVTLGFCGADEGEEGVAGSEGARETAGAGEGAQRPEAGKDDLEMHASPGEGSGEGERPAHAARPGVVVGGLPRQQQVLVQLRHLPLGIQVPPGAR